MAKKTTRQDAPAATLLKTLVPSFGGRPACGSDGGAVAARAQVGAFGDGNVLELRDLRTGEVLARAEIEVAEQGDRFGGAAIDPEGRRAAGVFCARSGWFVVLLEQGKAGHTKIEGQYAAFDAEGRLWTSTMRTLTRRTPSGEPDGAERRTHDLRVNATRGDGSHAVGSYGSVTLLLADGQERELNFNEQGIGAVGLCDTRPLIAVQCQDEGTVRVLDWETGDKVLELREPYFRGSVSALRFSPGGELLAVIGSGVDVYRLPSGERILTYAPAWLKGETHVGGFSGPADLWVAGAGALHRFDLARGVEVHEATAPESAVAALAWSRDGSRIAVARDDGTVAILNAESAEVVARLENIEGSVWDVGFAADDDRLFVVAEEVLVVDVATGAILRKVPVPRTSCAGSLAVSPDGALVAAGGDELVLIEARTGETVKKLARDKNGLRQPAWSEDGKLVAAARGSYTGKAVAFDAATAAAAGDLKPVRDTSNIEAVAVFDGELAALTSNGLFVRPLAAGSGAAVKNRVPPELVGSGGRPAVHTPSGRFLTSRFGAGATVISITGDEVARIPGVSLEQAAFRRDGKAVALSHSGGVTIWSLPS